MRTYADGQLAAASALIFQAGTDTNYPSDGNVTVSLTLANTSASNTETITITFQRGGSGATARRLAQIVLAPNESANITGVTMSVGDIINGSSTHATTVDYLLGGSGSAPFAMETFDSKGQLKQTNGVAITGATTLTSTSSNALAVGANGATNPVLNVNANTATVATGITIVGAAAASGVALQVTTSGTNEDMTIDAAAAGTVKIGTVAATALGAQVGSSTSAANASLIVQSTKTTALVVGRLGATTPAFQVDANTATSITGVKIKSAATGNGVAISAVGEASNGNMTIDAQGSGTLTLNGTATGAVVLPTTNITDAKNIVLATTTGSQIATSTTQKLGFFGATPVVQPVASSATSVTATTGSSTGVSLDTKFTGGGTANYTIGGVITALKALGLLAV